MAELDEFKVFEAGEDAARLWCGPIGAMSPLWALYAGAAGAGIAYWTMTRWARPVNLEAFSFEAPFAPGFRLAAEVAETLAALRPEPVAPPIDPAVDPDDPCARMVDAVADAAGEVAEAVGVGALAVSAAADDLTRVSGIGPTLSGKLAELGVRTFADIAAWTEEDIELIDKALDLKGRARRDHWVEQARQFAEQ